MSARLPVQRTVLCALWIALALCPLQLAWASDKIAFDIASGPADATLREYQQRTQLQVMWAFDDVASITTNELRGEFDAIEALKVMTQGTPLRFEFVSEDYVTLTVRPPQVARTPIRSRPVTTEELSSDRRSLHTEMQTITVLSRSDRPSIQQFSSPLLTYFRTDIDAFAFATPQELLRTLPQVFGGGPTEDTHIGFEAATNAGIGSGVNLRGLGAGSTLTLVNGRRLAGSGTEGIFTDVSSLPLSIIDRIEILPDSSSSVYGADAVGGVVNFVLLDSFEGAQTDAGFAAATRGALDQDRISQLIGFKSGPFKGLAAVDFYSRDSLPAADRPQARSDLSAFGGDNFDTFQSNPGTIIAGNRTWAVPAGQDGTNLDASMLLPDQRNLTNLLRDADLLASQQRWSVYTTAKADVSEDVQLFADALFSQRDVHGVNGGAATTLSVPDTNPFYVNPVAPSGPIQVAYNFGKDLGLLTNDAGIRTLNLAAGAKSGWGEHWQLTTTAGFASEHLRSTIDNIINFVALNQALADPNPETAFNPFGDGSHSNPATLARIRQNALFAMNSHIWSGSVTAVRDVRGLTGGHGSVSLGADYRQQSFASHARTSSGLQNVEHELQRSVTAAFATLSLPILARTDDLAGPNRLEVSLAARYENYSDFGDIVTPRFGLSWAPRNGVVFRGTWSTSFRPPNLLDLDESNNFVTLFPVVDPSAPLSPRLVLVQAGKNAALREEHAKTWTLGLDIDVARVPGLSTAATYFHTTFRDRMNQPRASTGSFFTDPAIADLVTRNFTPEQRQAVCNSAPFVGSLPQASCMTLPIAAIADLRVRNSAFMRTDGIDLLAQYVHDLSDSTMMFKLDGTYILSFSETQALTMPLLERVSTQNNPIDLRLRGSFDWQRGGFRFGAFINYSDGYRDIVSTPQRRVDSWTTVDLNLSYAFGPNSSTALAGTTFSLSAENVFDREPPFLNNVQGNIGYDAENAELMGRFVSFNIRKSW